MHQIRFPLEELTTLPAHQTLAGFQGLLQRQRREGKGREGRGEDREGVHVSQFEKNDPRYQMAGYGPEILLDSANWQRPIWFHPFDFRIFEIDAVHFIVTVGRHANTRATWLEITQCVHRKCTAVTEIEQSTSEYSQGRPLRGDRTTCYVRRNSAASVIDCSMSIIVDWHRR